MNQTYTFSFPDKTVRMMETLQKTFGVNSHFEVIGRALALAQFAAQKADENNNVVLAGKDNPLTLNLRD
jgi:hypothetical protein